jgi:hypothetical protein
VHTEIRDLQRGGKGDLVLSRIEDGIIGAKNKIIVYYNENGGLNKESPELMIEDAKAMAGGIIHDVSGDGGMGLIVPSIQMGILTHINMF